MADKIPLKGIFNGSGDPTGLAEFTTSDTIGFADGGTGLSALGTAGQVIKVNSGASALEFGNVADVINLDGANDLTSVTLELTDIFLVSDFAGLLLGFISTKIFDFSGLQSNASLSKGIYVFANFFERKLPTSTVLKAARVSCEIVYSLSLTLARLSS